MPSFYEISAEAQDDLFEILRRIAKDSVDFANRIQSEFDDLFVSLTTRPVLFFPLYSFLVVYQPDVQPIRIMAVLRGRRNVKRILRKRLR